jgi:hypothetical protein
MDREKDVFSFFGMAGECEMVGSQFHQNFELLFCLMHFQSHPHFLTWIPPAVFEKLAAAGFAKLAAVANARRCRALVSVAPLVALESLRFQLQQQQQQQ